jgi:hypothetical protein
MEMWFKQLRAGRMVGLVVALMAVLALGISSTAAAAPTASAAASCSAPKYPGNGYFTSLKTSGTGCKRGKSVALGHYRCRVKKGRSGRCSSRVLGYSCRERRQSIATEFNSRVTCRRGSARVVFTFQQNT